MKKGFAVELKKKAEEVASIYSGYERANNYNKERFFVEEIIPYSDESAAVVFKKTNGKKAVSFFYRSNNQWFNFFPSDSVILGMSGFSRTKQLIEEINFNQNFKNIRGDC